MGKDLIVLRDTATYSFGSSDFPVNVKELKKDSLFWFSSAFIGILFLLVLFFILSILYPKIEERKFFKEYVSPYKPVNNIIKLDNITNEPIKEGTLVVQRCKEVVPFYIWKSLGNQCPSYPECMDILGCDGCGKSDINYKFFSKSGSLKKYNWLFFGACGGFFAWVFTLLIIPVFHRIHLADLFQGLYEKKGAYQLQSDVFQGKCHQSIGSRFRHCSWPGRCINHGGLLFQYCETTHNYQHTQNCRPCHSSCIVLWIGQCIFLPIRHHAFLFRPY